MFEIKIPIQIPSYQLVICGISNNQSSIFFFYPHKNEKTNFKCYKFSSDVNTSAMGIKAKAKNFDWYAKGIGTVRTESYDKNGNIQSHTELVEVR
jgi:hypothetical protein